MAEGELRELVETLAGWAGPQGLASGTVERATWVVMDTVGVILRGALEAPAAALMRQAAREDRGAAGASATLLAAPDFPAATPRRAALANATAGTFLELDEGQRPTGHPAIHVLPAALAQAQALGRNGAELLGAFVAGYELAARLFKAVRMRRNIHPHGHIGAMGAALAAGLLRRWELPALEQAVRIAATLPLATTWQPCFEGATARNAFPGVAAEIGLLAADLAEAGFTGPEDPVGEIWGWVLGEGINAARLLEGLDGSLRPAVTANYFKRHACCACNHPALDALASLVERLPSDWRRIQRVEVAILERYAILDRPYRDNPLSARFSLPYAVAAYLVERRTDLAAFAPETVGRPEIRELSRRVRVRADPDWSARWPAVAGATVEVYLEDGQVLRGTCPETRWSPNDPPQPGELQAKFMSLAGAALPEPAAAALMERLLDLPRVEDVRRLFEALPAATRV